MIYSIQVTGIHCSGCINLIKITLEERGFMDVNLNENNVARFTSNLDFKQVESILKAEFSADLNKYKYSNLIVNN